MLTLYYVVFIFMFLIDSIAFVLNRKHLLSILLSLENKVLSLFCLLFIYLMMMNCQLFFSMMFLAFSVWEKPLDLSILISMIRTHENDYFQSFSILQC